LVEYRVDCDGDWQSREGVVRGWVGDRPLHFHISKAPDGPWTINGESVRLDGCIDLDFGFTPATNLFQLRRLNLQVGQSADVPVAWLDVSSRTLERISQRYERRSADTYWYESPTFDYHEMLRLGPVGFVASYPNLWEAES